MQSLSTAFSAHLAQEVTTLATCWSVTRTDGQAFYFTEHDRDLVIDTHVYTAAHGMSTSAVTSQAGLAVDNLEFEGMLSSEAIARADVLAGKFDHAAIAVFMVNYADLSMGTLPLKSGWLGEVTFRNGKFTAEIRGLTARLQQVIGHVYTSTCRAQFCDARCKLNAGDYTVTGTVTAIETAYAFSDSSRDEEDEYFAYGLLHFTGGANIGLSMEVRNFINGRFTLFLPMPYAIAVGDHYTVLAGCDKIFETCIARFGNAVNFRGEPHVPGTDKLLETSATRSR